VSGAKAIAPDVAAVASLRPVKTTPKPGTSGPVPRRKAALREVTPKPAVPVVPVETAAAAVPATPVKPAKVKPGATKAIQPKAKTPAKAPAAAPVQPAGGPEKPVATQPAKPAALRKSATKPEATRVAASVAATPPVPAVKATKAVGKSPKKTAPVVAPVPASVPAKTEKKVPAAKASAAVRPATKARPSRKVAVVSVLEVAISTAEIAVAPASADKVSDASRVTRGRTQSAAATSAPAKAGLPPIPAILLEGDPVVKPAIQPPNQPAASPALKANQPAASGPLAKAKPKASRTAAPFPQSGSLWLVARDPFCLCAHWNFDPAALAAYAAEHRGRWRLRVWAEQVGAWLAGEQPLPVEVTHRFVPVLLPATRYLAEVGFLAADGAWQGLAVSRPVPTPPDAVSADTEVTLATFGNEPVTPESMRSAPPDAPLLKPWRPSPARLLSLPDLGKAAQLLSLVWREVRRNDPGSSAELTELIGERVVLPGGATLGPTAGGEELPVELPSSESTPAPAPPAPRRFWFQVNAEVILYGSTERDARVTIGGQPVTLRDDGSFSFRFTLPDGEFPLPVIAVSAAGDDQRAAEVTFRRTTVRQGEVGTHSQAATLKPPTPDAVS
jgi:hypothetical protein